MKKLFINGNHSLLLIVALLCLVSMETNAKKKKKKVYTTEELGQYYIEQGYDMGNGVIFLSFPESPTLNWFDDESVVDPLESRSIIVYKSSGISNTTGKKVLIYYCLPFDNIPALFPKVTGIRTDSIKRGQGWYYDGKKFDQCYSLYWSGELENGMLSGKGFGLYSSGNVRCLFCGEYQKGLPVGDYYYVDPLGDEIFKNPKKFNARIENPVASISLPSEGYSKAQERKGRKYRRGFMAGMKMERYLDEEEVLQNCGLFKLVDFTDFKNGRSTVTYSYQYNNDKDPNGVIKMEIDKEFEFAGFLLESDKAITAFLDKIVAAQIKAINPTDLKNPRTVLEGRGIGKKDYEFCHQLKNVLTRAYKRSKKINYGKSKEYNSTILQPFPHLAKRFEMINALESLYDIISGNFVDYRVFLNSASEKGQLRYHNDINRDWLGNDIAAYMKTVRAYASDRMFPRTSATGLKSLEAIVKKLSLSYSQAYDEALKKNDRVIAERKAERERSARSYSSSSSRINSGSSDRSTSSETDVEDIRISDIEYEFTSTWIEATFTSDKYKKIRMWAKGDEKHAVNGRIYILDDGTYYTDDGEGIGGWVRFFDSLENTILDEYAFKKYGEHRRTGRK